MKIITVIYATFAAVKREPEKNNNCDDLHSYNSSLHSSHI